MELTPEQEAKIKLFKTKQDELIAVLAVMHADSLKINKGLLDGEKNCDYFRGVNFHVKSLANAKAIQAAMPNFKNEDFFKLKEIEDSIKLG